MIECWYLLKISNRKEKPTVKRIALGALICLLLGFFVQAAPIYKYETTVPITDSVTLTNVKEFHADHNMSYSYIKVDVGDENTGIELLKSEKGVDVLDTVENLAATNENTVAAVNADFFSVFSGSKGFSLGIEIKDGQLLQSPIYPDTMATTAFDGEKILMSYLDFKIEIAAPNGNTDTVRHLNKHTSYYGDILMYTSEFNGGMSPAPGGEVVEVVVEDNIVKEFRRHMEPVEIPENGCVLVVSEGVNMFLHNNFAVGDEIKFNYYISPSLYDCKTAFGGGSMLVFEGNDVGKIGDYTHTVAGNNPRTAIGVTKDGKTMYLVAVDGRQTMSRGMRMSHLAELMIDLGCYYAINLDGGGSTRMVASTLWDSDLHTVNSPTENRKVINAVAITFDPMPSRETENESENEDDSDIINDQDEIHIDYAPKMSGIEIKAEKQVLFTGDTSKIDVAVYDEHMRRMNVDYGDITWSASSGSIENGVFTANEGGNATVCAWIDEFYAETQLRVVETVSGIDTVDSIVMQVGEQTNIEINAYDYSGNYVKVTDCSLFEIESSDESVVKCVGNKLSAINNGTATVSVSKDGVTCFISVAVGTKAFDFTEDFEQNTGSSLVYPSDTKGGYMHSSELSYQGMGSGKIVYDFTVEEPVQTIENEEIVSLAQTEETPDVSKAVYYVLAEAVPLDVSCDKISIMLYSETPFLHELRAQFEDDNGRMKIIEFEGEVSEGQWNKLTAYIPENSNKPLTLKRVYVLYTPGEEKDSGCVYIDDLSLVSFVPQKVLKAPENIYRKTSVNANVVSNLRVGVLSDSEQLNPVQRCTDASLENYVKNADKGIVLGNGAKFAVNEDDNALYVRLDTSKNGIRNTDSTQWTKMTSAIAESNKENVFVLSDNSLFSDDDFENEVIKDYLSSLDKNVFVVTGDSRCSYKNINGVQYFTIDNTPESSLSLNRNRSYSVVEFSFGETVTFEFKDV